MTILFKMEGKLVKLLVNGPESTGYASLGGTYNIAKVGILIKEITCQIHDLNIYYTPFRKKIVTKLTLYCVQGS